MQDLPPAEGFAGVAHERHIPKRGPRGWVIFAGAALAVSYGLYRAGQGNHIKW